MMVCKNLEDYNPKTSLMTGSNHVFDDMIADMESNKKLKLIITELFVRGRKLNIPLVFASQSYFMMPKNVRLNVTQ